MSSFDVIVIGCGGMGSATLLELAQRGLRVLGIDRHAPPHSLGSSHGETRIIRKAYFEHPDYVPLLHRAWDKWVATESACGKTLLEPRDLVMTGPADSEVIVGAKESARVHGLAIENLSSNEARKRYPVLNVSEGHSVTVEQTAGFLWVERCVEQQLRLAGQLGATLNVNETVLEITGTANSVEVRTDQGTYSAGAAVVTSGPWTNSLLPEYKSLIAIRRKSLFWFPSTSGHWKNKEQAPIFLMDTQNGQFYGLPEVADGLVKIGEHTGGEWVSGPEDVDRQVSESDLAPVQSFLRTCLNFVADEPMNSAVCLYSMTTDGHFLLDRHASLPIVVAAGFSGHGFKFAPVIAEACSDLVMAGQTTLPVGFLSKNRFAN